LDAGGKRADRAEAGELMARTKKSLRSANWKEWKHPRDDAGKFARKGGASWAKRASSAFQKAEHAAGEATSRRGGAPGEANTLPGGRKGLGRSAKAGAIFAAHNASVDTRLSPKQHGPERPPAEKKARPSTFELGPKSKSASGADKAPEKRMAAPGAKRPVAGQRAEMDRGPLAVDAPRRLRKGGNIEDDRPSAEEIETRYAKADAAIKARKAREAAAPVDTGLVHAKLKAARTRDQASEVLAGLGKQDLIAVIKAGKVPYPTNTTAAKMRDSLMSDVSHRLTHDAIQFGGRADDPREERFKAAVAEVRRLEGLAAAGTQAADDAARVQQGGLGSGDRQGITGKAAWGELLSGPQKQGGADWRSKVSDDIAAKERAKVLARTEAATGDVPKRANVFDNPEFNASTGRVDTPRDSGKAGGMSTTTRGRVPASTKQGAIGQAKINARREESLRTRDGVPPTDDRPKGALEQASDNIAEQRGLNGDRTPLNPSSRKAADIQAVIDAMPADLPLDDEARQTYITNFRGTWSAVMERPDGKVMGLFDAKSKREVMERIADAQRSRNWMKEHDAARARGEVPRPEEGLGFAASDRVMSGLSDDQIRNGLKMYGNQTVKGKRLQAEHDRRGLDSGDNLNMGPSSAQQDMAAVKLANVNKIADAPEGGPVTAYDQMGRTNLAGLARRAGVPTRGKSNREIALALHEKDQQAKAKKLGKSAGTDAAASTSSQHEKHTAPSGSPQNDGLDRYRTTEAQYRQHFEGFTDAELATSAKNDRIRTEGRSREAIISDLAAGRAAEDRRILERNLAEQRTQAAGGVVSERTSTAPSGRNIERTEITGDWKRGGRPKAEAAQAAASRGRFARNLKTSALDTSRVSSQNGGASNSPTTEANVTKPQSWSDVKPGDTILISRRNANGDTIGGMQRVQVVSYTPHKNGRGVVDPQRADLRVRTVGEGGRLGPEKELPGSVHVGTIAEHTPAATSARPTSGKPQSWDDVQPGDTVLLYGRRFKVSAITAPTGEQKHGTVTGAYVKNDGTPGKLGNGANGEDRQHIVGLNGFEFTERTVAPVKRTEVVPPPAAPRPNTGDLPGTIAFDEKGRTQLTDEQTKHVKKLVMALNTGDEANAYGFHMDKEHRAQVGDEVMVDSFGRLRRGIVTKVTKNGTGNARVAYVTPSGGYVQEANSPVGSLFHLTEPEKRPGGNPLALLPKMAPEPRARKTEAEKLAEKEAAKAAEKARRDEANRKFVASKTADIEAELARGESGDPERAIRHTIESGLIYLAKQLGVKVANRESDSRGFGPRPRSRDALDKIRQDIIAAVRERRGKA
jgi:hypothetical protein